MTFEAQPDKDDFSSENSPEWENPQFAPVGVDSNTPLGSSPSTNVPKKRKKTKVIVTIVVVALLILASIGWFGGNALVAKLAEENLKDSFTSEGFSQVQAEIDSSPMLVSYFKDYYRHAKITAAEGEFKSESEGKQKAAKKNDEPLSIKDFKLEIFGLKGGDDPLIEKGKLSFSVPGKELEQIMAAPGVTMKREGNKLIAEHEEGGLKVQVVMSMQFEPGKPGESGKIFMSPEKLLINGSDELLGQKLSPADLGTPKKEMPLGLNKSFVLKNVDFSGNSIKFDIDLRNVKLKDIRN